MVVVLFLFEDFGAFGVDLNFVFFRALENSQFPGLFVVEVDLNRLAADFLFGKVDRGVSSFQAAALFVCRGVIIARVVC